MTDINEVRVVRELRRFLLVILVLAMTGTFADLLLMDHYADRWQLIPLVLLALAALTLLWHALDRRVAAVRAFQVIMSLFIVGGVAGLILHYQTSAAFHAEGDSTIQGWRMVWMVLRSKVPPTLAPAVMLQMGLIGLAYTYKHPALTRNANRREPKGESS